MSFRAVTHSLQQSSETGRAEDEITSISVRGTFSPGGMRLTGTTAVLRYQDL
jgi:hypothetical protein